MPLHIAVANGFAPETYLPMLQPLGGRFRLFSLPPRPLWDPPPPPESLHTWADLADDLLAGLRAHALADVVAIGHSFGAVASLLAAIQEPQRFRALILLDPTLLSSVFTVGSVVLRSIGQQTRNPLVKGALNRRANFATLDEAFSYWRGKCLFTDWSDEALRRYTESALHRTPGGGYTLRWSPAWEARIFGTPMHISARALARLRETRLPVLTVRGGTSTTLPPAKAARLRAALPAMSYAEVDGHGHLFPQSAPDAAAAVIGEWLSRP
jgi:pimeloyl-ACP methyl ester carboxylesterase